MKILLIGHRGWIASQLIEYINNNFPKWELVLTESRAENILDIKSDIMKNLPDRIVLMIGRTHGPTNATIDYLESTDKLRENIRDNLFGPLQVALIAMPLGIHVTYLGTGCIFDGFERPFTEDDAPNFFGSQYSIVKGYTDQLFHLLPNVLNLRIRMPITHKDCHRNFISKIIRYQNVCSIQNSMTVLDDFIPIFADLINKRKVGTFNCTNPGSICHEEILQMYQALVDNDFKYHLCSKEELSNYIVGKRSNNVLDTRKIEELYKIPGIYESVQNVLLHWKQKSD